MQEYNNHSLQSDIEDGIFTQTDLEFDLDFRAEPNGDGIEWVLTIFQDGEEVDEYTYISKEAAMEDVEQVNATGDFYLMKT